MQEFSTSNSLITLFQGFLLSSAKDVAVLTENDIRLRVDD